MKPKSLNYYFATLLQLFIPLLLLWITRFAFAIYNADLVDNPSFGRILQLSAGGFRFDLCAWAYFNCLFIAMRFFPARFVTNRHYILASNVIYGITNSMMLLMSVGDIPFFRFSGSRLRLSAIRDMFNDPNIGGILLSYAEQYWWAFLIGILVTGAIVAIPFILRPDTGLITSGNNRQTLALRSALFLLAAGATFTAMRGTMGSGKPLAIADAVWYTDTPPEANIVLNTPFCVLRSAKGGMRLEQMNFFSADEAEQIRSSVHRPGWPTDSFTRKNVMVITLESGSKYWIDRLNDVPGTEPLGLMPFLDSLASASLVNTHMLATGKRSIEGITAIYAGFPTFGDMLFMPSPYNANRIDSYANMLKQEGYSSRFYFGGNPGSYSIAALAKAMGYDDVADRNTYNDDSEFNGQWGIYDHAMAKYAANDLSNLKEPFVAGWFTLDLHGPFNTPGHWRPDGYKHAEKGPLRSAEYTDRSIRRFFEIARTTPWYRNTIFIITGDHGCRDFAGTAYDGHFIQPHVMFLVYAPDGSIAPGTISDRYMTQFDIGPTILGLLRYGKPYISVGSDMYEDVPHFAIGFFNGQYQVTGSHYLITLTQNARGIDKVFDIKADPLARNSTATYDSEETGRMLRWAQAFLQDYTHRMNADSLHR